MPVRVEPFSPLTPVTLRPGPGPGLEAERSALVWEQDTASARRLHADPQVIVQPPGILSLSALRCSVTGWGEDLR